MTYRMILRQLGSRGYSQKSAAAASSSLQVPNVMVQFGTRDTKLTFISHPGVMAVAKLLEMRSLSRPKAMFTQDNVNAIAEFDQVLAEKCQMALDNGIEINMMDVEYIKQPGFLEALIKDKKTLETARVEVLNGPVGGPYKIPDCLNNYKAPTAKSSWNPSNEVGPEIFEKQPGYRREVELRGIVKSYLESKES